MSPAIVNAGMEASVSLASPNGIGLVVISVSGTTATITLTIEPDGIYQLNAWLSDDTSGALTSTPPDTSGTLEWRDVLTDSSGQYVFTVQHVGAVREWYFCYTVGGGYVNVNDETVEVGV